MIGRHRTTEPRTSISDIDEHSSHVRRAFTLTELLVVLAILGVLAGLIMATVTGARSRGDQVTCLNNVRQIVNAWLMYSSDFSDRLVPNVDGLLGGLTNWVAGNMAEPSDATDRELLVDANLTLMSSYIRNPRIYKCPADDSSNVRSVAMNCRLNPRRLVGEPRWVGGRGGDFHTFRRLADIAEPERVFVVIDESGVTINDGYFAVDMSNTGNPDGVGSHTPYFIIDFPAARHARSATVSFADGHVVVQRWVHAATFSPVQGGQYVGGSPDARWLQEHCTYVQE